MKIIITGLHCSGKKAIAEMLEQDGIKVGRLFSNLDSNSYNSNDYTFFNTQVINEIFENKAYVYLNKIYADDKVDPYYEGISDWEWDQNQVFVMQPNAVLNMSAKVKDDILYIWLDNKKGLRHQVHSEESRQYDFDQEESIETMYINEFIEKIYSKNSNVMYFNNEDERRVKTIIKSIINHPEDAKEYIQNFN